MLPQKKRQIACTITEKKTAYFIMEKNTACAITEKRQMACGIMKKKKDS